MYLFVFCFYCVGQLLLQVYVALGDDEEGFHRYIVEEGFKPPLFGSYSYNLLREVFQPRHKEHPSDTLNERISTAVGSSNDANATDPIYRHHATRRTKPTTVVTTRLNAVWARKAKANITKSRRAF